MFFKLSLFYIYFQSVNQICNTQDYLKTYFSLKENLTAIVQFL